MVLFLREHRQVALHVACGDITDVKIENGKLSVLVHENMLASLLSDGRRAIENALRWQGLDLNFEVNFQPPREKTPAEQDIEKLQKMAGEYLKIKE